MTKELTEEQKKLADQMIEGIRQEIVNEGKTKVEPEPELAAELAEVEPKATNPLVDGIISWGNTLDFNNVSENSVLLIKVNVDDAEYAHHFQMGVVRHVLEPRYEMLKSKKVTVLFMSDKDDLSILKEDDMAKSGWVKKEPSRIILPS